jgi:hypothetical protein
MTPQYSNICGVGVNIIQKVSTHHRMINLWSIHRGNRMGKEFTVVDFLQHIEIAAAHFQTKTITIERNPESF